MVHENQETDKDAYHYHYWSTFSSKFPLWDVERKQQIKFSKSRGKALQIMWLSKENWV